MAILSEWTELFHKAENPSSSVQEIPGKVQPKNIAEIIRRLDSVVQGLGFTVASSNDAIIQRLSKPEQKALAQYLLMLAEISRVTREYYKMGRMETLAGELSQGSQPYSSN